MRRLIARVVPTLALVAAVVLAGCSSGSEPTTGTTAPVGADPAERIEVRDARIPEPANPDVAAVYATIVNSSQRADVLEAVATDAGGTAEIHQTTHDEGMATMGAISRLEVPASSSVELAPGGHHVMILDPTEPLTEGGTVKVEFRFRDAGTVTVDAPVVAPTDVLPAGDHDTH